MFQLEALNAEHGDALLLRWGETAPQLAVIDGGPRGVFDARLRARLEELRRERGAKALDVRLVLVSHIDDDHIAGIVDLFAWLKQLDDDAEPLPLNVVALWHNSFKHVLRAAGVGPSSLPPAVTPADLDAGVLPAGLSKRLAPDTRVALASVAQGDRLRSLADGLAIDVNPGFGGLVMAPARGSKTVKLGTMTLTVLGPSAARLGELRKEWAKKSRTREPKPAELAAYLDETASNLSSIVVLAACGRKRMLLTGDARGDEILTGLERARLIEPGSGRLEVDVLKVPHHGSARNVSRDFFERIVARNYVISANGRDDNPDLETLQALTETRGEAPYRIWMTNDVPHARAFFAKDREKRRGYEVMLPRDGAPSVIVIP